MKQRIVSSYVREIDYISVAYKDGSHQNFLLCLSNTVSSSNANLHNKTILYDCNEGRLASPDKGSPKIFSTLTRYLESSTAYQSSSVKSSLLSNSKVVKICN